MPFESFLPTGQGPSFPALTPADEESLLSHLGRQALSGIGFAASTLGKPGRAVRGLLGGQGPSALLNLLPFSDTLGITDPANDVSGRDLLHKAGLADAPGKGFEWADIPGFLTELATDPLMYVNPLAPLAGGALTATGKAAQKAGTLAPRLAERVAQGQAGLLGYGIPLVKSTHGAWGTGPTAEKIAQSLGAAWDVPANSGVGRGLATLFNKGVANTRGLIPQNAMLGAQEAVPGIEAPLRGKLYDALKPLMDSGELEAPTRQSAYDTLAQMIQGHASPLPGPLGDLYKDASSQIGGLLKDIHGAETGAGKDLGTIQNYLPREWAPLERPTPGYLQPRNPLSPGIKSDIGREEILNLPTGQHGVDALAMDPLVSGPNRKLTQPLTAKTHIFEQHLGESDAELRALQAKKNFAGGTMTPQDFARLGELLEKEQQATKLADWAKTLDPKHAAENIPFFSRDLPKVLLNRLESSAQSQARMGAVHDIVAKTARAAQLPTDVPIGKAYEQLNMANQGNMTTGAQNSLRPLLSPSQLQVATQNVGSGLHDLHIPREVADDITRSIQGWRTPEGLKPLTDVWDAATNLFRMGTTNPLLNPGRMVRNLGQDLFMAGEQGANPLAKLGLAKAALREGATTPEAQALQREAFVHKVAGPGISTRNFEVGSVPGQMPLPGDKQKGLLDIIKGIVPKTREEAKPWNIAGIGGRTEAGFTPARVGQEMDTHFSDLARGGAFAKLIQDGWAPEAAAKQVGRALYDYGNMSDFERNVMKRLAPFYSWTRQNVPGVMRNLAENPGGATGVGLRAAGDVRQKEGFLPPFLADTLAMPIGERTPEGTQRFLSTLGLPFEDAFSDMGVGHGTVTGNVEHTLSKLMAHANPIIKGGLELATGKQFESGRELSDLSAKGLTGNTLADQVLMNSPLSKGITDVRTLMDERKGIGAKLGNLISPAKIKDIDMNNQREIEARNMVEDYLRQNPNIKQFQRLYVPKDQLQNLSPADVAAMRLETSLIERQEEAGYERRAKAGDADAAHKLQLLRARRGQR